VKRLPAYILTLIIFGYAITGIKSLQTRPSSVPEEDVWVMPILLKKGAIAYPCPVVIWFDEQFLANGRSYEERILEFSGWKRSDLRQLVTNELKTLSYNSWSQAESEINRLQQNKIISQVQRHWIINGFSCQLTSPDDLKELKKIPGVKKIFARVDKVQDILSFAKPEFYKPFTSKSFNQETYKRPWYIKELQADRVWKEFGITGQGIINIIHDNNFMFSKNLILNLYHNPGEIPDNEIDDDNNGYIDDYHGYNFDNKNAGLVFSNMSEDKSEPNLDLHGFQCTAIVSSAGHPEAPFEVSLAPGSKWAGVIGHGYIAEMVEWAVMNQADTYCMSFSRSGLGEYRNHWRKVLEHGSLCGLFFVSGAGNIARPDDEKYAEVPFQMLTPEDIPLAVFSASGVRKDLTRPSFSSQGPVKWKTEHYRDGLVPKPDICTFNAGLPALLPDGSIQKKTIAGNSFSGAMLCSSIALILSADPELLPWDLRDIIISTATDIGPQGHDSQTGHGLINCYKAVQKVLQNRNRQIP